MSFLESSIVTSRVDPRHWRVQSGRLHATFLVDGFSPGVDFAARVARAADAADHHPDLDLRYGLVHVSLHSHDVDGLSERDVALAATITAIADELGLASRPGTNALVELAVDALDIPAVSAFWAAILQREVSTNVYGSPEASDPARIEGPVWFQQLDEPRNERNTLHVDVIVGHDEAEARVAAGLAAGGRLVTDRWAPAFWVLADPEGNEACVCTWQEPATGE